jgi:hypothetical protein
MRKMLQKLTLVAILAFISGGLFAQVTVSGVVYDADNNETLFGATVVKKGTSLGTTTDMNGKFTLQVDAGESELLVSFVGYTTATYTINAQDGESVDLGDLSLKSDSEMLNEVVVSGVVDIAQDRKTPVAVSTLRSSEIQQLIGTKELPEVLNYTPSVYATKQGGAFGDSRINIRGFDQRNTAVMINGMPVNDMENGWVYWSNWAGLADVTSAMQVQRGLGSSKLAISSVGGTINILTKTTDIDQGGKLDLVYGNDNYLKTLASYNTGKMDNGFAASVLLGRTAGDGYVTGTKFEAYNYYLAFGYETGNHNFQLTITGAPQVHNQRTTSFFNMADLADYQKYGNKYNYNHGYLNGEEFNWRRNFYHKPIASLNWDWDINETTRLSTVLYASFGRGGGTGDIGVGPDFGYASSSRYRNPDTGEVDWDKIVAFNSGEAVTFYDGETYQLEPNQDGEYITTSFGDGLARRASMNSHNWVGMISNLNKKLNENFTFDIGFDLRTYKGIHYRRLDNLLGADGYFDDDNINDPVRTLRTTYDSDLGSLWNVFKSIDGEEKIDYYNDGLVNWAGLFTQLEYTNGDLTAFVQAAISHQGYKRVDYFNYEPAEQETDWENIIGGNVKGGLNYNLNDNHNVFANAGYYSKQPLFDAVWINFVNQLNEDYRNEGILGLEVGYGYRSSNFRANVNLYRTSWKDRFVVISADFEVDGEDVEGFANLAGVEQVHMGIEVDAEYRLNNLLRLNAMFSSGNWEYVGDVSGTYFDNNQNALGEGTLFLDGVKVGDAAQITGALGANFTPVKGLFINANVRYASKLYARINAEDFDFEDHKGSLELPSFTLVDAGVGYTFFFNNQSLTLKANMNNVFDTEYISESATNYHAEDGDDVYDGINTRNKVFFGWGRSWNVGLSFNF